MKPNLHPILYLATGAAITWSGLASGIAQQAATVFTPAEIEARRQSVGNLESHIAQRQERLGLIITDIRSLDDRVEGGVNKVVTMLGRVKDSEESKVRIATVKADVITGLRRSIDYYNNHRDVIREQLRTGKSELPKETLEKDLAIFDERINKRVTQIAELAKSFTDPQELEKYEVTSRSNWYGWVSENVEINSAWEQNRRESRHTTAAREGVADSLRESIQNLRDRNTYLTEKLKESRTTEIERDFYQFDIARNSALIDQRLKQLEEFQTGSSTETKKVMRAEAHNIDELVQSAREDLREDFFTIFRKYSELNRARAELKQLEENLEARKKWLLDYDQSKGKAN